MRFYLAVSSAAPREKAPVPGRVLEAARALAERVLPVGGAELRHQSWVSPAGNTALLAWSNEPEHAWLPEPLVGVARGRGQGVLGCPGYLADADGLDRMRAADDIGEALDRTGGAFGAFLAMPDGFDAVTSITRTDPVYHCERAGLHLAGNRAALTHLVARAAEQGLDGRTAPRPEYDIGPMQALVRQGFYISDHTPFAGLSALSELSTLRVREGRARIIRRALPEPGPAPRFGRNGQVAALADALVDSVEPVRRHSEGISLSLTGGRDSRLVAAVLHAAGIPFRATTRGFEDHPDVILARRVCRELGVEDHEVTPPQRDESDSVVVEHPLPRTTRLIRMTEGMNSAFENVITPRKFLLEARLSGSGGEALRGGWLLDQKHLDPATLARRIRTITHAQSGWMTSEAERHADELYDRLHEECAPDFTVGLDRLFLKFRSGRWLPGSRTATLIGYCMYHPFLDHRVRWEAMSLSPSWRWSEEVVHRLLSRFAPGLARMPIADRPWRFDHRRVYNPAHRVARKRRPALRAKTTVGGFDWRRKLGPEYVAEMRDLILDTPQLFDLVDRAETEAVLAADPVPRPNQVWNLYTLAVLLSDEWLSPSGPAPERVRVPIR